MVSWTTPGEQLGKETSLEAVAVAKMRDDEDLNQGINGMNG
jgi:hypothetical protein